jgi:hypothetical protein
MLDVLAANTRTMSVRRGMDDDPFIAADFHVGDHESDSESLP